jgi:hypothetical protein
MQETANMKHLTAILRGAALIAVALPTLARAAQAPAGNFYQLNVTTSFEPNFNDCWAFSSNGRFIVSHGGGLGTVPYQLTGLNSDAGHFQAVSRGRIAIGFSGVTGATIAGDAVDSLARTYHFTGKQVGGCGSVRSDGSGFQTR